MLLLFISGYVKAAGWHEVGNVIRVHTGHGTVAGAIYFTTDTQIKNASCTSNSGYTFDENNSNSERIYSMLLAAYLSKTPISIYTTNDCLAGRPKVDAIQVKDSGVPF